MKIVKRGEEKIGRQQAQKIQKQKVKQFKNQFEGLVSCVHNSTLFIFRTCDHLMLKDELIFKFRHCNQLMFSIDKGNTSECALQTCIFSPFIATINTKEKYLHIPVTN